jgi:hypothetical protein
MSRISELKKQNPYFDKSIIDVLSQIFEKSKYIEMIVNLTKEKIVNSYDLKEIKEVLLKDFELSEELIESFSIYEILNVYSILGSIGRTNIVNLKKFIDYNERKLVARNDLSTYKTFNDLESQISLTELKLIDKELQSQIKILYDKDEWLMLKPLSYEASLKYGASTKWCTAMKSEEEYFTRYSKRGILIYCINRFTGKKIAAFKNINPDFESETSFWDDKDTRLDSMETDLPLHILSIIRDEFTHTTQTNWDLFPDDYKIKFDLFKNNDVWAVEQPNVAPNQGGLGLAIRRAITYDEVENEIEDEIENAVREVMREESIDEEIDPF